MPHKKRTGANRRYSSTRTTTRTSSATNTPSTKNVFTSHINQPGGGYTKDVTQKVTPGSKNSTSTVKTSSSGKSVRSPSLPDIKGNASFVMIAAIVLYLFAFWKQIGAPIWDSIWNGKPSNIAGSQLQIMLGGVVFVIVLTGMASFEETAGVATISIVGLWAVYLVMNGKQFVTVLNWLQGQNTTSTSSSTNKAKTTTPSTKTTP